MKRPMVGQLAVGIDLFYILHSFRDRKNGWDLILRLLFPALRLDSSFTSTLNIFLSSADGACRRRIRILLTRPRQVEEAPKASPMPRDKG